MAKQVAEVEIHAADVVDKYSEDLDVSVDKIDDGLYLGNLACARDCNTLSNLQITHILTLDLVPLPRSILERTNFIFNFVKIADVPREDLISHLPGTNDFIKQAIASGGNVLVHCYFGVSRSAAVVIAYIMEKYGLCYEDAFILVKTKRRFISPNVGFQAQLRLFGHMDFKLNRDDPRFKQFRLKMAGQKLKQVKILPQKFADLVKPDPGLVRERPDPIVYRCRKCRRIVASQANIIPHLPKQVKVELIKKGLRPPASSLPGVGCAEGGELLVERLRALAATVLGPPPQPAAAGTSQDGRSWDNRDKPPDGYHEGCLVDPSVVARGAANACRLMWFVEPMAWMRGVGAQPHGKLACPKCQAKLGSFSWVMGCRCPCGQKVAPAFYMVPSKVEWSNVVQNVQLTL